MLGKSALPNFLPLLKSKLLGENVALAIVIKALACCLKKKNNKGKQN